MYRRPWSPITRRNLRTYSSRKVFLVERNRVQAAVRSLPWAAVVSLPATTGFPIGRDGRCSNTRHGIGCKCRLEWRIGRHGRLGRWSLRGVPVHYENVSRTVQIGKQTMRPCGNTLREQSPSVRNLVGVDITPFDPPPLATKFGELVNELSRASSQVTAE